MTQNAGNLKTSEHLEDQWAMTWRLGGLPRGKQSVKPRIEDHFCLDAPFFYLAAHESGGIPEYSGKMLT